MTARKTAPKKPPTRKKDDAPATLEDLKKLFWSQVRKTKACWYWKAKTLHGWPRFDMGEQSYSARRAAYELTHGAVDSGLKVLSTCRKKRCVNPDHLKAEPRSKKVADEMERARQEVKRAVMENNKAASNVIVAHERRQLGDASQLMWDRCQEPQRMLGAVTGQPGFGALPGPARWSTELAHLIGHKIKSGGHVDQLALRNTLLVAGRLLRDGDADQPATLLHPILRRMGSLDPNMVATVIADVVRSFYPSAPEGWV